MSSSSSPVVVPHQPQLPPLPPPPAPRVEALSSLSAIPSEYIRPAHERSGLGDALDLARTHAADETSPQIPVVDISAFLSSSSTTDQQARTSCIAAVCAAASEWGVMHVSGHGIPAELTARVRAAGEAFFALPIAAKEAYANDPAAGKLQGYGSRLAANASGRREWEDYLFHRLHPSSADDHTSVWPKHPPEYVSATAEFGRHTRRLASTLLQILSIGLGQGSENALEKALTTTKTTTNGDSAAGDGEEGESDDLVLQLKINYYPRCPQPELAVGVEAHTDVSALSIIMHNAVPGLQVMHASGRWVTARDEPYPGNNNTLVVHVGDALEIVSNGRYKSVLHRGLVNRDRVRISWVVFCEPPPESVVLKPMPELVTEDQPARFTPRTFREHLDRKLFRKKQQEEEQKLEEEANGDHHLADEPPQTQQTN